MYIVSITHFKESLTQLSVKHAKKKEKRKQLSALHFTSGTLQTARLNSTKTMA